MKNVIFLGKRLLLLGSGELGKELVIEAQRLGLEIIAVDKYPNAPAMQVADSSFVIDMNDRNSLINLIKELQPDFVIPEIESISIDAIKKMEKEGINIVPNARTVEMTMNRDKIRDLASSELKIRTANYAYAFELNELKNKSIEIGFPLIIKPLMSSSGKGQNIINKVEELSDAWKEALSNSRGNIKGVIIEEFIKFDYEFTLLTVRTGNQKNIFCPPIGHEQVNGDYQCSWQPLQMKREVLEEAKFITSRILDNLNGAGIYGVEFFVRNEEVIFSELSPRPHDTGMVTLISQNINEFELHLRAFLDLPIPSISLLSPSATRVILSNGDYKEFDYLGLNNALQIRNTKVLIFGKTYARNARRMGVALATGDNELDAREKADLCAREIKIVPLGNI